MIEYDGQARVSSSIKWAARVVAIPIVVLLGLIVVLVYSQSQDPFAWPHLAGVAVGAALVLWLGHLIGRLGIGRAWSPTTSGLVAFTILVGIATLRWWASKSPHVFSQGLTLGAYVVMLFAIWTRARNRTKRI